MSLTPPLNAGDSACTAPGSTPTITQTSGGMSGRIFANWVGDLANNGFVAAAVGQIAKSGSGVATVTMSPVPFKNGDSVTVYPGEANFPTGTYTVANVNQGAGTFTYNDSHSATATNGVAEALLRPAAVTGLKSLSFQVANAIVQELVADTPAWTAWSTFAANTGNLGSPYAAAAYRKDAMGVVWVKGMLAFTGAIANLTALVTLPTGFKPAEHHQLPAKWGKTGTGDVAGVIMIDQGGQIRNLQAHVNGDNLSIDCSFLAEQ